MSNSYKEAPRLTAVATEAPSTLSGLLNELDGQMARAWGAAVEIDAQLHGERIDSSSSPDLAGVAPLKERGADILRRATQLADFLDRLNSQL